MTTTPSVRTSATPATSATAALPAVAATIGLAAAGWAISVPRMAGMDMGAMTTLGSFSFFVSVWVPMMAAMMLPGVLPSAIGRRALDVIRYVGSYLVVWTLFGVLVFTFYRPHSGLAAGFVTGAAGMYELTPVKRRFRTMCRERRASGWAFGTCCVGSTAGLMLAMVALGPMSVVWMTVIAAAVLLQKAAPPNALIDVPVAMAILGVALAQFVK